MSLEPASFIFDVIYLHKFYGLDFAVFRYYLTYGRCCPQLCTFICQRLCKCCIHHQIVCTFFSDTENIFTHTSQHSCQIGSESSASDNDNSISDNCPLIFSTCYLTHDLDTVIYSEAIDPRHISFIRHHSVRFSRCDDTCAEAFFPKLIKTMLCTYMPSASYFYPCIYYPVYFFSDQLFIQPERRYSPSQGAAEGIIFFEYSYSESCTCGMISSA